MPRNRGRAPAFQARGYRPSGDWSGEQIAGSVLAANTKLLLATIVPSGVDQTIRRTHVQVSWSTDQSAAVEAPTGAIGIGVFNDTAVAAGIASLPDPITDIGDSVWMMFQFLTVRVREGTGALLDRVWDIDTKAMRKLPLGKTAALIIVNAHATVGAVQQASLRTYTTQTGA